MKQKLDSYQVAKILFYSFLVFSVILAAWAFASWVDIVSDNNSPEYQTASWNLFKIALDILG